MTEPLTSLRPSSRCTPPTPLGRDLLGGFRFALPAARSENDDARPLSRSARRKENSVDGTTDILRPSAVGEANPEWACPRCHRVTGSPLTRVELYLDILEYQELEICDRCIGELRRADEILHFRGEAA